MPPWEFEKLIAEKRAETLRALRKKSLEEAAKKGEDDDKN